MRSQSRAPAPIIFLTAVATLAAGCGRELQDFCDGRNCQSQRTVGNVFQTSANRKLDVLFVVDDTTAAAPFAPLVVGQLPALANVLQGLASHPSMHVAFVPAVPGGGPRGVACHLDAPDRFLRSESCGQTENFSGSFTTTFSCLGDFGAAADGPAQPLAVIEQSLGNAAGALPGFLRADAFLQIVVIAGVDDASSPPASATVDFLKHLKTDPAQIAISIVAPEAFPRLAELAQGFGANGSSQPPDSLLSSVPALIDTLSVLAAPTCLEPIRDRDSEKAGLQAECTVTETTLLGDGRARITVIPSCDVAARPCWMLTPPGAGQHCGGSTRLVLSIDRADDYCADDPSSIRVECLGCLDPADPACAIAAP